jgi:hypothetical protein
MASKFCKDCTWYETHKREDPFESYTEEHNCTYWKEKEVDKNLATGESILGGTIECRLMRAEEHENYLSNSLMSDKSHYNMACFPSARYFEKGTTNGTE